jgi:hypothetical protein
MVDEQKTDIPHSSPDGPEGTDLMATDPNMPTPSFSGPVDTWLDVRGFEHCKEVARYLSNSAVVPEVFQGKPYDCFVITQLAFRLGCDPFALLQATYVVHGKPGMEAKMQIALLNQSGHIIGPIRYEFFGGKDPFKPSFGCRAIVTDALSGQEVTGPPVTWSHVTKEGWDKKKGSKWLTIPEMMYRYRAAAWLIRTHYPEVTSGMLTSDEVKDSITVTHRPAQTPGAVSGLLKGEPMPEAEAAPQDRPVISPDASGENAVDESSSFVAEVRTRLRNCATKEECADLMAELGDDPRAAGLDPLQQSLLAAAGNERYEMLPQQE